MTGVFSLLWRAIAGLVFGAGMSSLAQAATASAGPAIGPSVITLFGQPVPVMSALFGVIGVVLARRVAPVDEATRKLGPVGNIALTALLALGVLAFVVTGEKRPIVALGWACGLGYSGIAFIALVAQAVRQFARSFLETFVRGAGRSAGDEEA